MALSLRYLALAVAIPAWSVAVTGQDTVADGPRLVRESGFGRVLDTAGQPWVGAKVFLEHRAHPQVSTDICLDLLEATTDARGQFKVKLLPGARYTVWARGEIEDGTFRQTNVAGDATGHSPILLRERKRGFVRRVELRPEDGDDSWAGVEPTFWVGEDFGRVDRFYELEPENGVITLPPTPDPRLVVEVWHGGFSTMRVWVSTTLAEGRKQLASGVELGEENVTEEALVAALKDVTTVPLKPLHRREILFRGPDAKPVADAVWWPDSRAPSPRVWRTGKDGVVEAFVASEKGQPRLSGSYVLWAPGCAEWSLEAGAWTPGEPPVTERVLRKGVDVRGRLLLDGKPLAHLPLVLQSSIRTSESSTWFGVDGRVLHTDGKGRIHVPGRTSEFPYRLEAALPPTVRERLSGDGYPAAAVAILTVETEDDPAALGDVRLDRLRKVDLRLRSTDGTPPGSLTVLLKAVGGKANHRVEWPHEPTRVHTDRRGKVRILASSLEDLFLLAGGPTGSVLHRLGGTETELDLRLDPRTALPVRVVYDDGTPAAGARLSLRPGVGQELEMQRALRDLWSVQAFPWSRGTADENGRAVLVAPVPSSAYSVSIYGSGIKSQSHTVDVEDRDAGEALEIVVRKG